MMQILVVRYVQKLNAKVIRRGSSRKQREGFGSFHSPDVEILVRQSAEEFVLPVIYEEIIKENLQEPLSFGTNCGVHFAFSNA